MKNLVACTTLACLIPAGALAAATTELKVSGVIKPPACTPTLAAGGVIDYGVIPAGSLNVNAPTALAEKAVGITISCSSAVKVGYRAVDNRQASMVKGVVAAAGTHKAIGDNGAFGLGVAGGANIGAYTLRIEPASVAADGSTPDSLYSNNGTWTKSTTGLFGATGNFAKAFSLAGTTTPAAYKNITATLSVQAIIDKASNLPLAQDIQLDGSATIEVLYL